jgi:hypothetical protein
MTITFPNINPTVTTRGTVAFQALADEKAATCEISVKALQDHFGASSNQPHDLLTSFISGKSTIHDVARAVFPNTAGQWLLVSTHFSIVETN